MTRRTPIWIWIATGFDTRSCPGSKHAIPVRWRVWQHRGRCQRHACGRCRWARPANEASWRGCSPRVCRHPRRPWRRSGGRVWPPGTATPGFVSFRVWKPGVTATPGTSLQTPWHRPIGIPSPWRLVPSGRRLQGPWPGDPTRWVLRLVWPCLCVSGRAANGFDRGDVTATKTVKALFQEAGIPPWQRVDWPLLYVGDQLLAVPSLAVATDVAEADGWEPRWTPR